MYIPSAIQINPQDNEILDESDQIQDQDDQVTNMCQSSTESIKTSFQMDQQTIEAIDHIVQRSLKHLSSKLQNPEIKSVFEKFIDSPLGGAIGGSLAVILQKLVKFIWAFYKKKTSTPVGA
jgi:hypothetical protein